MNKFFVTGLAALFAMNLAFAQAPAAPATPAATPATPAAMPAACLPHRLLRWRPLRSPGSYFQLRSEGG